jgi:predicted dehydrogenase
MSIRCAVIGVGYLGKFHAQKYAALPNAELVAVVDSNRQSAEQLAQALHCRACSDLNEILDDVDAISIVAPTTLHHKMASECLRHGIHVLVEKPITTTLAQADELIELARENKCVLQVGHLERFNAAILALGKVSGQSPLFIESHRLAPFKPRATDVNVVLDLMIHDIDIILDLVKSDITDMRASGASVLSDSIDIANARLEFANGCVANLTASRVSQKSERKMRLFQKDTYLSIDFQEKALDSYRKSDIEVFPGVPEIKHERTLEGSDDALLEEIKDFLRVIRTGEKPAVSGEDGRRALEAAIQIGELL